MLRCTFCGVGMAFVHGHARCGSGSCPLYGLDQCEPATNAEEDAVAMSDVLRPSSPGLVMSSVEEEAA
jgi:hypothetical protein